MHVGTELVSAIRSGARVRLGLFGPGPSNLECDHVIAATGYQYDIKHLSYVDLGLRRALRVAGGAPVVSRSFKSSVPGLHFMGGPVITQHGPVNALHRRHSFRRPEGRPRPSRHVTVLPDWIIVPDDD